MYFLFGLGREDGEYVGAGWGVDGCRTCEPAKCGEDGIGLSKVEAGESQRLLAHAADPYAGMDMARETISITMPMFRNVMDKSECPQLQVLFMHFDACVFIPILFENVMITFDQPYVDAWEVVSPSPEKA